MRTPSLRTFALALLAAGACKSDSKRSEIMLGLATDLGAPTPLHTVKLEVFNLDRPEMLPTVDVSWPISGVAAQPFELPGSFGIYAEDDYRPRMKIQVTGLDIAARPLIRRTAVVSLVKEETLFMRMGLTLTCMSMGDCPAELTCVEGHCREPLVDVQSLPNYLAQMESKIDCMSGTQFRNTSTGLPLELSAKLGLCSAEEYCREGTCYKRTPTTKEVEMVGRAFTEAGVALTGVKVEWHQGRVDEPSVAQTSSAGASGDFRISGGVAPDTKEILVYATGPGLVPQLAVVPLKSDVFRYAMPLVLSNLKEVPLTAGPPQDVAAGNVSFTPPAVAPNAQVRLRYGVLNPLLGPGRLRPPQGDDSVALQSIAMVYTDVVLNNAVVNEAAVTVHVTPPADVMATSAEPYRIAHLDSKGGWEDKGAVTTGAGTVSFTATGPGFWNVERTYVVGCVRGVVLLAGSPPSATPPDAGVVITPGRDAGPGFEAAPRALGIDQPSSGGACRGARVLGGPDTGGTSAFDTTDAAGGFCLAGAQGMATILRVGDTTRGVQIPRTAGSCAQPATCTDVGIIVVPASDCTDPKPPVKKALKQVGQPCKPGDECVPGSTCFNEYCVGAGYMRVSLAFDTNSDFDLHLRTPAGNEIDFGNRSADGGELDVDQCVNGCEPGKHVENIVFKAAPPAGHYEAWVENYNGAGTGAFTIEVAGTNVMQRQFTGTLPMMNHATSQHFTFDLP